MARAARGPQRSEDELAVRVEGLLDLASAGRPRKRRVIVATTIDCAIGVRSGLLDELVVLVAGLLPVAAGISSRKRRVFVATSVAHAVGVRMLVTGAFVPFWSQVPFQWPPASVLGRGLPSSPPPSIMPSGSEVVAGTVLPFWSPGHLQLAADSPAGDTKAGTLRGERPPGKPAGGSVEGVRDWPCLALDLGNFSPSAGLLSTGVLGSTC